MNKTLIIAGTVLLAVAIIALTLIKVTDPYRGYDFSRTEPQPIVEDTLPPLDFREGMVQHPITGKWITEEQAQREAETVKAILCSYGKVEYCED